MGHRLLKSWFQLPLKDYDQLSKRLAVLDLWTLNWNVIEKIRTFLESSRDIYRLIAKFERRKVTAQDFLSLSATFKSYIEIKETLEKNNLNAVLDIHLLKKLSIKKIESLAIEFQKSFNDELGASLENGNLFKAGISIERDQLLKSHLTVQEKMNKLESQYKEKFQLPNLRIKSNSITGFYIEISKSYVNRVPAIFDRFQTLTNVERYTSKDLKKIEREYSLAQEKLKDLDLTLFNEFIEKFLSTITDWTILGNYISLVDVFQSLTFFALSDGLTRPNMCKNKSLKIQGAWHPILKSLIGDKFIGHDFQLSSEQFFALVTGPNMSGKTTFMREVAICQFLMQIGSYVPAKNATLGIIDALFSRLGANDFIFSGQSTFMVEMNEASEILRQATDRSLIILDEIGRGTSTYDGISIAWSLAEYLHNNPSAKPRTLFATHYHELNELAEKYNRIKNFHVAIKETANKVIFLRKLVEGGTEHSFGIHVAKMAGMPKQIVDRANEMLHELESQRQQNGDIKQTVKKVAAQNFQLSFFDVNDPKMKRLAEEIENIEVNAMTPVEAIMKLHELKKMLEKE